MLLKNTSNQLINIYTHNIYPKLVENNNTYNEEEDGVRDLQSGPQEIILDYTLTHQSYDEMEGDDIHVVEEEDEYEAPNLVIVNPPTEFSTLRIDEVFQRTDNTDEETGSHTSQILF